MADSNSVKETLLSSFLATQQYMICPWMTDIHRVDLLGTIRLDIRFLYNQISYSNSVTGTIFSSFPAFQRYKPHPYTTCIHGALSCYRSVVLRCQQLGTR